MRKSKVHICDHQADSLFYLMSDVWFANIEQSIVIHDTESPYCDQVSLNNTKFKLQPLYYKCCMPSEKYRSVHAIAWSKLEIELKPEFQPQQN